ncbi:MAG: hypothetical protein JXJ04_10100, partial [Spirochaetales bacterium]|nr:hypothetical protein [Spirochaetales bacterium]
DLLGHLKAGEEYYFHPDTGKKFPVSRLLDLYYIPSKSEAELQGINIDIDNKRITMGDKINVRKNRGIIGRGAKGNVFQHGTGSGKNMGNTNETGGIKQKQQTELLKEQAALYEEKEEIAVVLNDLKKRKQEIDEKAEKIAWRRIYVPLPPVFINILLFFGFLVLFIFKPTLFGWKVNWNDLEPFTWIFLFLIAAVQPFFTLIKRKEKKKQVDEKKRELLEGKGLKMGLYTKSGFEINRYREKEKRLKEIENRHKQIKEIL